MTNYNLVAETPECTVVSEYQANHTARSTTYQSEAALEKAFIEQLKQQAYEYLPIKSEQELIFNLRNQLETLNDYLFTPTEWERFYTGVIAKSDSGIVEKTTLIQEDCVQLLKRDDGTVKNIRLIDKDHIHNNRLQVINQYVPQGGSADNRYDVTILVNGLPLIHIELKRRGVDIKEAFNQINRYQRESFWSGCGLFEFVQIFVISNGTYTKYYSNTTRFTHIKELSDKPTHKGKRTSNSFEFTSWWADANNVPITDLMDFAKTFFAKHTILNLLTKYCVFTTERILLAMRPYQIVATEKIITKINIATQYKRFAPCESGGYIWHTTGSGKTLTSFKTAQIASKLPYIDKVLFVVDRKDLDYQTMKEYDRFEKGAANGNTSTTILKKQLEDDNCRIIVTTIQKLSIFTKKNTGHPVFKKHLVLIFDECHRSQFGDMHRLITKHFKQCHLFGFTGTPIFAVNSYAGGAPELKTTEQAFGEKLHTYTIVNAINDKNVLPFRIDYVQTIKQEDEIIDKKVSDIDREKALLSAERIHNVVAYILEHFNQKTKRNDYYQLKERRLRGFNSIFCVQSIEAAKLYYTEFQKQMETLPPDKRLKIATIYSYAANEADDGNGFMGDENSENTDSLDMVSKDFLQKAIHDYNQMFNTTWDITADKFQSYYKDLSQRVKNREVDLLLVVNMFLTGFDATTLNTLWVDKNLRLHGLLQAYSRTNRILNSVKTFGNIVCFRNLEEATNESIALFGDKDAGGIVLLKTYEEYYEGYTDSKDKEHKGYKELVELLLEKYPIGEQIIGEQNKKDFIKLYGAILKLKNILSTFDKFEGNEILSDRDVQDYHSTYIDLYNEFRPQKQDKENINDDVVFEMELIKQVEINIDYILMLIKKYHDSHLQDKEIVVSISKAVNSSMELRNKKELIEQFIDSLTPASDVDNDWRAYVQQQKEDELNTIIAEEKLKEEETKVFMDNAFKDGELQTTGTAFAGILPPVSRFSPTQERTQKRERILERIKAFFERFKDLI